MSTALAMSSLVTSSPSGGVCGLFIRLVSMKRAAASASAGEFTSFTKPALPRPPACTWALTTASGLACPVVAALKAPGAASIASITCPEGTGMP